MCVCVKFGFYFTSSKRASSHYSKGTEVSGSKSSKTQVHPKLAFYTKPLFSSTARAGEKICCAPVFLFFLPEGPLQEKDKQHAAEKQTSPEAAA